MKYTKKGPGEHFDVEKNAHRDTCPDLMAAISGDRPTNQCSYFEDNCSGEDVANDDMNRVCRVRQDIPEDTQTVDMIGGGR